MSTLAVSQQAEDTITLLVAWELLGIEDVDPKQILREMPIDDLFIVRENIIATRDGDDDFLSIKMVELEVMYRSGLLRDDWYLLQTGKHVSLRFSPLKQGRSIDLDLITTGGIA